MGRIVAETDYIATVSRSLATTFEQAWGVKMYEPPIKLPPYKVCQSWHERFAQEPGLVWLRGLIRQLFAR